MQYYYGTVCKSAHKTFFKYLVGCVSMRYLNTSYSVGTLMLVFEFSYIARPFVLE